MISVTEAQDVILGKIAPLPVEQVDLVAAVGRVLGEDITAHRALPPWDNSAMDGYAVRAAEIAEVGVTLPVSQHIPAGCVGEPLKPGTVARIFTGAPVPPGADSVVMQENTAAAGPGEITFTQAATPGRHIRRKGEDVTEGTPVLAAGRLLAPGDLALLAAQGRSRLKVVRAPQVAIVSSGDELVDVDAGVPGPGQIVNSNVLALAAAVRELGACPRLLPIIPDDRAATFAAIEAAASADVLITSGGVSVGDHDYVGHALKALSGDAFSFWKVAIKPGKPLSFGHIGRCAAFGLPGNPISALVTFELFVKPALLRMMGHAAVLPRAIDGVLAGELPKGGGRETYARVRAWRDEEGRLMVDPRRSQSSGALSSLAGADALVQIPVGQPALGPGAVVPVYPLSAALHRR